MTTGDGRILSLQADGVPKDLQVELNGEALTRSSLRDGWTEYSVAPRLVRLGVNRLVARRGEAGEEETRLKDLQLSIRYQRKGGR